MQWTPRRAYIHGTPFGHHSRLILPCARYVLLLVLGARFTIMCSTTNASVLRFCAQRYNTTQLTQQTHSTLSLPQLLIWQHIRANYIHSGGPSLHPMLPHSKQWWPCGAATLTSALLSAFFKSCSSMSALLFGQRPWEPAAWWLLACKGRPHGSGHLLSSTAQCSTQSCCCTPAYPTSGNDTD